MLVKYPRCVQLCGRDTYVCVYTVMWWSQVCVYVNTCLQETCMCCFFVCACSNVVEKCVTHSSRQEKAVLIDEVLSQNDGYVLVTVPTLLWASVVTPDLTLCWAQHGRLLNILQGRLGMAANFMWAYQFVCPANVANVSGVNSRKSNWLASLRPNLCLF